MTILFKRLCVVGAGKLVYSCVALLMCSRLIEYLC